MLILLSDKDELDLINLLTSRLMDGLQLLRTSLIIQIKMFPAPVSAPLSLFPRILLANFSQTGSDPRHPAPLCQIFRGQWLFTRPHDKLHFNPSELVITKGLQDLRALQTKNYLIICFYTLQN